MVVVVQYDPNQLADESLPYTPKHGACRVWLESSPYQRDCVANSCQGGRSGTARAPMHQLQGAMGVTVTSSYSLTTTFSIGFPLISPTISVTSSIPVSQKKKTSSSLVTTRSISTATSSSYQCCGPDFVSVVTFSMFTATVGSEIGIGANASKP